MSTSIHSKFKVVSHIVVPKGCMFYIIRELADICEMATLTTLKSRCTALLPAAMTDRVAHRIRSGASKN
jgi:hypothetical protein